MLDMNGSTKADRVVNSTTQPNNMQAKRSSSSNNAARQSGRLELRFPTIAQNLGESQRAINSRLNYQATVSRNCYSVQPAAILVLFRLWK